MGLIGRNNDLVSKILEIFGNEKKNKKKKDLVRKISDEQGYSKNTEKGQYADLRNDEVDGHLLVGEKIEKLGVVGGSSC